VPPAEERDLVAGEALDSFVEQLALAHDRDRALDLVVQLEQRLHGSNKSITIASGITRGIAARTDHLSSVLVIGCVFANMN